MKLNRLNHIRIAAAAFLAAAPLSAALAQAAIAPGTQVVDPSGNAVGIVTTVKGGELIVKTDRHEVLLPSTSFTPHEGKLLFAMTREQLNADTDAAIAEANASLVAGVAVHGAGGNLVGQIEEIDEATVTVKLTTGELVRMPRTAIAAGDHGAVLGVSADELKAMASQADSASGNGAE